MTEADFKKQVKALERQMQAKASVEAAAEIVKRGRGRPPSTGRGSKRGTALRLMLSPEEHALATKLADWDDLTLQQWARRRLFG